MPLRIFVICFCLAAQGCTYQAWYAGFQERQRQECYENTMSSSDTRRCLDKVNDMSYDQYKHEREQNKERSRQ